MIFSVGRGIKKITRNTFHLKKRETPFSFYKRLRKEHQITASYCEEGEKKNRFVRPGGKRDFALFFSKKYRDEVMAVVFIVFLGGVFMTASATQRASMPIPYQGRLMDSNYATVADGDYNMKFAIYDSLAATTGCQWMTGDSGGSTNCENRNGATFEPPISAVTASVSRGLFTKLLGDGTSANPEFTAALQSGTYFLEVWICTSAGGGCSTYQKLAPRKQLGGVPYSYNSDLLDGWDPATGISGGMTLTGGSGTTDDLTLKATSGVGTSGSDIIFGVGNNGATEAVRILYNGRVGIGKTVPTAARLHIGTAVSSNYQMLIDTPFGDASANGLGIAIDDGATAGHALRIMQTTDGIWNSGTPVELFEVTYDGKVGIGTTTPGHVLEVASTSQTLSSVGYYAANSSGGLVRFKKSRGATVDSQGILSSGDTIAALQFLGSDGNALILAADIQAQIDGTPGLTDMPGRLVFKTTLDGASASTQRMAILNSGVVTIGGTTNTAYGRVGQLLEINTSATYGGQALNTWSTTAADAPVLDFNRSKSASLGTYTAVASGDAVGSINFRASDTNVFRDAARINVEVDGTPGINDMPGRLMFATTPDGSFTLVQRMAILNSGVVTIGGTTNTAYGTSGQLLETNTTANYGGTSLNTWSTTAAHGSLIAFKRSKSATIGTHTIVATDDSLGGVYFGGSDGGSAFLTAASIRSNVDTGTPSTTSMPGRLSFWTTPDGSTIQTQRMIINSAGVTTFGSVDGTGSLDVKMAALTATTGTFSGRITAGSGTTDGTELLLLNTERPWSFFQRSTGASTYLDLRSSTGAKYITITGSTGEEVAKFNADGVSSYASFASPLDATSITTGALRTAGGLGVTKAAWIGGLLNVAGAATFQSTVGMGALTATTGTFSGLIDSTNLSGSSYNENMRLHPSTSGYSSIALGAVAGSSGTGVGQWTFVRYPVADTYKFSIRYNATDQLSIASTGAATFAGPLAITGALTGATTGTFSSNLTVNTSALAVDAANFRVGIGIAPTLKLDILEQTVLPATLNAYLTIARTSINGGTNLFQYRQGVLRRVATPQDWTTADWYDGIAIDSSFLDPASTMKTWIRRNPNGGVFTLGNGGTTYATLNSAGLTLTAALTATTGTFSGAVNANLTTDSTTTATGSLITAGGLGVGKKAYFGDTATATKTTDGFFTGLQATNTSTGTSAAAAMGVSGNSGGILLGKLGTSASAWSGYGSAGDTFIYSSSTGGADLNIINAYASGGIYFFAGKQASGTANLILSSDGSSTFGSAAVGMGALTAVSVLAGGSKQTNALISARNSVGIGIEFGHTNSAGYGSTIGAETGSGAPFIGFSAEGGTTANTYRTRGIIGTVLRGTLDGGLTINKVATATADNQSLTQLASLNSSGNLTLTGALTATTGTFNGDVIVGAHDGSDRLYVNRYSSGTGNAYISAGSSDQNAAVGFQFQYRDSSGVGQDGMVLTGTGLVGIGTPTPGDRLDVRDGNLLFTDADITHSMTAEASASSFGRLMPWSATDGGLWIKGLSDADGSGLVLNGMIGVNNPADTTAAVVFRANKYNSGTGLTNLGDAETAFQFRDSNENLVTILGNGNVGIGTVTPASTDKLTIFGAGDVPTKIFAQSARADANTPSPRLYFYKDLTSGTVTANDVAGLILVNSDDASNNLGNSHQILFQTSGVTAGAVTTDILFQTVNATSIGTLSTAMVIQGGNVGIGTTSPSYLLDVAGTARVAGIITNADYTSNSSLIGTLANGNGGTVGNSFYAGKINTNIYKSDSESPTIVSCGASGDSYGIGACTYAGTWSESSTNSTTLPTGATGNVYGVNHSVTGGDFRPIVYSDAAEDLSSRTFTFSLWVKADAALDGQSATWSSAFPGDSNQTTGTTVTLSTSWQRVYFTRTLPSGGVTGNAVRTYFVIPVHATAKVYFWGIQIEESPFITPYQKTTGTQWATGGYGMWASDFRLGGTPGVPNAYWDNSTNRLGIGTTGPDRKLDILDASNPQLRLTQADGTVYSDFQMNSGGDLVMSVDGVSNQLVLDDGGLIGIGTTSPSEKLSLSYGSLLISAGNTISDVGTSVSLANTAYSIAVSGKYAIATTYLTAGTCSGATFTGCEFEIIDISNPAAPAAVSGSGLSTDLTMYAVAISGRYAFVGQGFSAGTCSGGTITGCEFFAVDISNPASPSTVGGINFIKNVLSVTIAGKYAYVGMSSGGGTCSGTTVDGCEFVIIDISNPASPTAVAGIDTASQVNTIVVHGKYAYIGQNAIAGTCSGTTVTGCELIAINISNPSAPSAANGLDYGLTVNSLQTNGGYVYVGLTSDTNVDEFRIVSIKSPSALAQVGTLDIGTSASANTINDMVLAENYAYLAISNRGSNTCSSSDTSGCEVIIIDVKTPTAPSKVGGLSVNATDVSSVAVSGKHIYFGPSTTFNAAKLQGIESPSAIIGSLSTNILEVTGSAKVTGSLFSNSINVGIGGIASQGALTITSLSTGSTLAAVDVRNSAGTSLFYIRDDGNIGIGTTAPGQLLQVGDGTQTTPIIKISGETVNNASEDITSALWIGTQAYGSVNDGDNIAWKLARTRLTSDYDGRFSIYSVNRSGTSEVDGEKFSILLNGNIGIGTTTPRSKLEINGTGYPLGLDQQDAAADAFISHNAYFNSGYITGTSGDALSMKWNVTHGSFGSRGIGFAYGTNGGIFFFASTATTTADSAFTPTARMRIGNDGAVKITALASGSVKTVCTGVTDTAGTLSIGSSASSCDPSDLRLKTNIVPLTDEINVLDALNELHGVYFNWKADVRTGKDLVANRKFGLIAQDVEKILPELISENKSGYKGLEYDKLTAFLIEVAKAQQLIIDPITKGVVIDKKYASGPFMTIDKDGRIGIGTDTPTATLDVHENQNVDNGEGKAIFGLSAGVSSGDAPSYKIYQGKITTDGSNKTKTINRFVAEPGTLYSIEAKIVQRNPNNGNGGSYTLRGVFKTSSSIPPMITKASSSIDVLYQDSDVSTVDFDATENGVIKINVISDSIEQNAWNSTVFVNTIKN